MTQAPISFFILSISSSLPYQPSCWSRDRLEMEQNSKYHINLSCDCLFFGECLGIFNQFVKARCLVVSLSCPRYAACFWCVFFCYFLVSSALNNISLSGSHGEMNLSRAAGRDGNTNVEYTVVVVFFILFTPQFLCNSIVFSLWCPLKLLNSKIYWILRFSIHPFLLDQQSCIS